MPTGRQRSCAAFLTLVASALLGCPPSSEAPGPPPHQQSGAIDLQSGPRTKTIITTIKDGKPFVGVDMLPEIEMLRGYPTPAQARYLQARAIMLANESRAKPEFAGKSDFVVKMILVTEFDEYARPQWATSPELARFEVTLPTTLPDVATADLTPMIRQSELHLENLEKGFAAKAKPGKQ